MPEELGPVDTEDRSLAPTGSGMVDPLTCPKLVLAKAGMSGRHADPQLHQRAGGHQGHPETPGAVAG
jgi:hypothetical protein